MNLRHTLVEIHAIVFLLGHTDVGTGSERVVLFLYLLNGGNLAKTENILVFAVAELFGEPFVLTGCFKCVFKFGYEEILLSLDAFLVFALGIGNGLFGRCFCLSRASCADATVVSPKAAL